MENFPGSKNTVWKLAKGGNTGAFTTWMMPESYELTFEECKRVKHTVKGLYIRIYNF